ncbi:DUF2635 domain-containing protein [uncultured Vibrio sp.]|uniref:DUF2635 domain-containing protein n=1 Tax=uncultured Vibrio sp. TaxID=114054 RepID=UPI0025E45EB7|nr:DUF2635 domain-containing protein [uncultured Vibrio sp.]
MEKKDVVTFKIKPKKGLLVKDPLTRNPLKAEGETKPRSAYWLRRVQDKDCIVMDVKTTTKRKTADSSTASTQETP